VIFNAKTHHLSLKNTNLEIC